MIIDCIGCLHGSFPNLDGGDLLIVTGDLTARDTHEELDKFDEWFFRQPYQKKIFIGGNHDNLLLDEDPKKYQVSFHNELSGSIRVFEKFEYLCDSGTKFYYYPSLETPSDESIGSYQRKDLKIWGSPWTKKFEGQNPKAMAFCLDTDEELEEKWKLIPDDIDILITHCPPYGILDKTDQGEHVGCPRLKEHVIGRVKPKLHIFSHIHEMGGREIECVTTKFINCSIMNERYKHINKPVRLSCKWKRAKDMPFMICIRVK